MSGFSYLDLYFEFQESFKSVKDYSDQKEIIRDAMRRLVDVFHGHNNMDSERTAFVDAIKLVYPNYFTPISGDEKHFEPIEDNIMFLNDSSEGFEELGKRVRQHMSYYMTNVKDSEPFTRISKSLIESEKTEVHDFYVKKESAPENNASYYNLVLNGDFSNPEKRQFESLRYPDCLDENLFNEGILIPLSDNKQYSCLYRFDSRKGLLEKGHLSPANVSLIHDAKSFFSVFHDPLTAHFIMLEHCSLLYVYSQTAQINRENGSIGYGGIFALIDRGVVDTQRILNYIHFFRLVSDGISTCIAHNIMRRKLEKEADKSAKAAIMARNMSHNLGSHVMAYLKQHTSSVTTMFEDNVFSDLVTATDYSEISDLLKPHKGVPLKFGVYKETTLDVIKRYGFLGLHKKTIHEPSIELIKELSPVTDREKIALPFLVGLGGFISYLQERQDFIATIATDYIPYFSTVNFKDFVYDELNPDKRFLRHQDRRNLKPDNILLGNIARSEGLGREISPTKKDQGKLSDIVIKFRNFDGNPTIEGSSEETSLEEMRKIDISLPGGVVGRQAIFSIVENVVRNAAKHGNWRQEGKLELKFDFIDKVKVEEFGKKISKKRILSYVLEERQLKSKFGAEIKELSKNDEFKRLHERFQQELNEMESILDQEQIRILISMAESMTTEQIQEEIQKIEAETTTDSVVDTDGKVHLSLLAVLWLFYSNATDSNDLHFVTLTDNVNTSISSLQKLREALKESYTEDGIMKDGNKGIKELRISSAWIRGAKDEGEYYIPDKEIIRYPQKKSRAPLMYARLSREGGKKNLGHLQYIFCLPVPKKIAIITDSLDARQVAADRKLLSKCFSSVFTPEEYVQEKNRSYAFILCENKTVYNRVRPVSASKIALINEIPEFANCSTKDIIDHIINCVNEVEEILYKFFSLSTEDDCLCIDDEKAVTSVKNNCSRNEEYKKNVQVFEKNGHKFYRVGQILVTDGGGYGQYVYRTHHDSPSAFEKFMTGLATNYQNCQFVESITGNNSTDRLIRNELLDNKWFYSHIRAMKLKVALFDERLFSKVYGLEEVSFTRAHAVGGSLDEMKQKYCELFCGYEYKINACTSVEELNSFISNTDSRRQKLSVTKAYSSGNTVTTFFQKGIFVYTFIKDPHGKGRYGLYGANVSFEKDIFEGITMKEGTYRAECVKIATLSWENNTLVYSPESDVCPLDSVFDYISIHQGLLDKLYDAFGINDNEQAKELLTKQLYLKLKKGGSGSIISVQSQQEDGTIVSRSYLPGLIIHSGRSRPSQKDMPQLLPFIQYATIEHAVMDCKYSLVELLDNARYE